MRARAAAGHGSASSASSTARSPIRPTATPMSARSAACAASSTATPSPSASPRRAARARRWPTGSFTARPNRTLGLRPSPLWRLRRPTTRGQRDRALSERIRDGLPVRGAPRRAPGYATPLYERLKARAPGSARAAAGSGRSISIPGAPSRRPSPSGARAFRRAGRGRGQGGARARRHHGHAGVHQASRRGAAARRPSRPAALHAPPAPGRIALACALTPKGGSSASSPSPARRRPLLPVQRRVRDDHDFDLLRQAPGRRSTPANMAPGTLVLAGPRARDVLAALTPTIVRRGLPLDGGRDIEVAETERAGLARQLCRRTRLGAARAERRPAALYEALCEAGRPYGIADFGLYAMDACGWRRAIAAGRAISRPAIPRFAASSTASSRWRRVISSAATRCWRRRRAGRNGGSSPCARRSRRRRRAGAAPVFSGDGKRVGLVTSGGWCPTFSASLALAYLRPGLAAPGASRSRSSGNGAPRRCAVAALRSREVSLRADQQVAVP